MKASLVKTVVAIVVIVLIAIVAVSIYLSKVVAPPIVDKALRQVEAEHAGVIKNISYTGVNYTVWGVLNKTITLKGVQINLVNTPIGLHADSIQIKHYNAFEKNPLGSFEIQIKHLQIQKVGNIYTYLIAAVNNDGALTPFNAVFKNVPPNFDLLSADLDAQYNESAKTLNYVIDIKQGDALTNHSEGELGSVVLTTNEADFLNNLQNITILQSTSKFHIEGNVATADLQNASPLVGNFVQSLGYAELAFSLDNTSQYSNKDHTLQSQLSLKVKDLGNLDLSMNGLMSSPNFNPAYVGWYKYLTNPNAPFPPTTKADELQVKSLVATFTDLSFMSRLYTYMGQKSKMSAQMMQSQLIQTLQAMANMGGLAAQFAPVMVQFLQSPGNITLTIHPAKPIIFDTQTVNYLMSLPSTDLIQQLGVTLVANQK